MNLSTNMIRFYQSFGMEKSIDLFSEAGFTAIDFNADIEEFHNDVHDRKYYENLRSYAESRGILFTQSHAPFGRTFENSDEYIKKIVKSIENVSYLASEMIVVHPCKHLDYKEAGRDKMIDYNINFYKNN